MRFFSELIVLYEDGPMPEADTLCPSLWKSADFDSDGDFYAEGIGGRWTRLELTRRGAGDPTSQLTVSTYYANNRLYEPSPLETDDLKRYVDHLKEGQYRALPAIASIRSAAVTSLAFETIMIDDYREFLETVHAFLQRTGGIVANFYDLDAAEFHAKFLAEAH